MSPVDKALKLIGEKHGLFGSHLSRLDDCRLRVKPSWGWCLPKFSTTMGPRSIWLASGVARWPLGSIAANLVHESIHLAQWRELGRTSMALKYSQKDGRLELELEALRANVWWWLSVGSRGGYEMSARIVRGKMVMSTWFRLYLENIISHFGPSYFMGKWFDQARQASMRMALHGHVWGYLSR